MTILTNQFHSEVVEKEGSIMITRTPDSLFQSNELAELQVKMLQMNDVPHIIPPEIEDINLEVRIRYKISGKIPLSQYLRGKTLTNREFQGLLLAITNILVESSNYMLISEHFIIDENYIFVGDGIEDLSLLYLPIKERENLIQLRNELKYLLTNLIVYVDLHGKEYQEMIKVLNQPEFTVMDLQALLKSLTKGKSVSSKPSTNSAAFSQEQQKQIAVDKKTVMNQQYDQGKTKVQKPIQNQATQTQTKRVQKTSFELKKLSQKELIYLIGGALLVVSLIWKYLFLANQSEGSMYLSIGLTILVADLIFILIKVWRPWGVTKKVIEVEVAVKNRKDNKNTAVEVMNKPKEESQNFVAKEIITIKDTPVQVHQPEPQMNTVADYYQNLSKETEILGVPKKVISSVHSEETTLLSQSVPYLEITDASTSKRVEIISDHFVVGRNQKEVQYVCDKIGVSRTHFEIISREGNYYIKDLGSSNGTKLNQQRILPYQEYVLTNGDTIQFAKQSCVFIVGEV